MFVEGGCSWDKRRRISPTNTDTDWLGVQNLFLERSRDTDTDTIRISLIKKTPSIYPEFLA